MAGKPTCLVCQKEMVRGFITDLTMGSIQVPRWCEGEPQSSRLGGATTTQFKEGNKVVAYRCPECEALRLYAPSAE